MMSQHRSRFRRELGVFDFTLLVIGSVIGADVYVVAALGASYLGPAQLVAWLAAGLLSALIALAFIQCAAICPNVGGSYAYARTAFGPFVGFLAGWALYVGEWVALAIFPLAFVSYLASFLPSLAPMSGGVVKALLVGTLTVVNVVGVRTGSRVNDVLTVAKLIPLALLIAVGLIFAVLRPADAARNLTPFAPLGWDEFGMAVVLIFWAYAGFELAVLPAGEVLQPRRTMPRGLIFGMSIVTIFYLLTAFAVVVGLPWQAAAASTRPLSDALGALLTGLGLPSAIGPTLMILGGLISIAGVDDAFTLAVARLSYAIADDGLFPTAFARVHPRYGTPYVGLILQGASALVAAILFDLTSLIAMSVFFLGICYVLTAFAALRLVQRSPECRLHVPLLQPALVLAALSGAYLSTQVPVGLVIIGVVVMVTGVALFVIRGQVWQRSARLRGNIEQDRLRIARWVRRHELWLLHQVERLTAYRSD